MKKLSKIYLIVCLIFIVLCLIAIPVIFFINYVPVFDFADMTYMFNRLRTNNAVMSMLLICTLAILVILIIYKLFKNNAPTVKSPYTQYLEKRLKELDKLLEQTYNNSTPPQLSEKEIKNATASQKNNKRDVIASMLDTTMGIDEYFSISKKQAKFSFYFSVISCFIGLLFLLTSIVLAIVIDNITAPIVSAIGAAIAELMAATVLWVHNKSELQLNHYYNALHENEKFLSAINLVSELSEDKRDEVFINIINKQLSIENNIEDK